MLLLIRQPQRETHNHLVRKRTLDHLTKLDLLSLIVIDLNLRNQDRSNIFEIITKLMILSFLKQ